MQPDLRMQNAYMRDLPLVEWLYCGEILREEETIANIDFC
jgi:hypothetical protein